MSISIEIPAKVADMSSTLSLLFCHPKTKMKVQKVRREFKCMSINDLTKHSIECSSAGMFPHKAATCQKQAGLQFHI